MEVRVGTPTHSSPTKTNRPGRSGSCLKSESCEGIGTPRKATFETFTPETPRTTQSEKLLLPCTPRARSCTPDSPRRSRKASTQSIGSPTRRGREGSSVGSVGSPSRRDRCSSVGSVSCPDSPRSFQKMLESTGPASTYSEYRRNVKRERQEFKQHQKNVHRENSAELRDIKEKTRAKVEDRISQHAMLAEKAWQDFSKAIREVDAEDVENHRNHLYQIICHAEPRVNSKMSPRAAQMQRRSTEDRVENLMRELLSWREHERELEQMEKLAKAKISDDLSDMTKDVRKRLGQLRSRMRSYDSKVFALQERALDHLRSTSEKKVDSWHCEDTIQLQEFFQQRTEVRRRTRSLAMQKYATDLRSLVDKAEPAVDSYIDDEVKGLRQLPYEVERSEVQRLQDEIRQPSSSAEHSLGYLRTATSTSGVQTEPWWITGERRFLTQPTQSMQPMSPRVSSTLLDVERRPSAVPSSNTIPSSSNAFLGSSAVPSRLASSVVIGTSSVQQLSSHCFSGTDVGMKSADGSVGSLLRIQDSSLSGIPQVETMSISTAIGTTPTSVRSVSVFDDSMSVAYNQQFNTPMSMGCTPTSMPLTTQFMREQSPGFSLPQPSLSSVTISGATRSKSPPLPLRGAVSNEPAVVLTSQQNRQSTPRALQTPRFQSSVPPQAILQTPRNPVMQAGFQHMHATSPTRQTTNQFDIHNNPNWRSGIVREQSPLRFPTMGPLPSPSPMPSPSASPRPSSVRIQRCESMQHKMNTSFTMLPSEPLKKNVGLAMLPSESLKVASRSGTATPSFSQSIPQTPLQTPRHVDHRDPRQLFVQTPRGSTPQLALMRGTSMKV